MTNEIDLSNLTLVASLYVPMPEGAPCASGHAFEDWDPPATYLDPAMDLVWAVRCQTCDRFVIYQEFPDAKEALLLGREP